MSVATKKTFRAVVNGAQVEVLVREYDVLLDVLREQLNLVGTKRGCDMGTCGCCTVMIDGRPRMSCLVLALEADGREITTIEGIRDGAVLHPLQACWAAAGASQCGFCSPGFIMAAKHLA
ncbi:MAG: 2Fe-2S iron-sulfur cluster binding domain-containing protein, partial [Deltaproteobacteria bacterium]|nr:2Fe-2S iron-sulfur cluster binding domain-containing protein [Deltaproteobacteria bacterium]